MTTADYTAQAETNLRNSDLAALRDMLMDQHTRKVDVVAPASKIRAVEGSIVVAGAEPQLTEDGVTQVDGVYRPTSVMLDGLASKLNVPVGYLKKVHATRPDLFDANVNGWLHGRKAKVRPNGEDWKTVRPEIPGDDRSFLVRAFSSQDGHGLARAFLSDKFKLIDNLDALTAALDGIRAAGVPVQIRGCDLTESRMYVRIQCEAVRALAPALLKNYRSPFTGASGDENPTVFAGLILANSEVGSGAWTITPQLVVQVCDNGMTITKDALRAVHLGGRMAEGVIQWSEGTQKKEIELIRSRTKDAVRTFLDTDYITRVIVGLEETAAQPVKGADKIVKAVGKKLTFSEEHTAGVLDHFIKGGQQTAGGIMQAVTSFAQTIANADDAANVEAQGIRAMELAAAM
jgi:hypothetical protein